MKWIVFARSPLVKPESKPHGEAIRKLNIIKNTLMAIRESERAKIEISLSSDKDFNYLVFKDTAIGIPFEKLDAIFDQFSGDSKEGDGLGLAFCKMTMQ